MKRTPTKIDRTMAGLRDSLFEMMEMLKAGEVEEGVARTYSQLAITAIKSVEVQIDYERLRLDSKVPGHLPEMKLTPPLKVVNE
jgi:hypothetical protein